jgi:hypothetical protein
MRNEHNMSEAEPEIDLGTFIREYNIDPGIYFMCGPGSSVGIATDYGLDGLRIESCGFGGLVVSMLWYLWFLLEKPTACLPSEGK